MDLEFAEILSSYSYHIYRYVFTATNNTVYRLNPTHQAHGNLTISPRTFCTYFITRAFSYVQDGVPPYLYGQDGAKGLMYLSTSIIKLFINSSWITLPRNWISVEISSSSIPLNRNPLSSVEVPFRAIKIQYTSVQRRSAPFRSDHCPHRFFHIDWYDTKQKFQSNLGDDAPPLCILLYCTGTP